MIFLLFRLILRMLTQKLLQNYNLKQRDNYFSYFLAHNIVCVKEKDCDESLKHDFGNPDNMICIRYTEWALFMIFVWENSHFSAKWRNSMIFEFNFHTYINRFLYRRIHAIFGHDLRVIFHDFRRDFDVEKGTWLESIFQLAPFEMKLKFPFWKTFWKKLFA